MERLGRKGGTGKGYLRVNKGVTELDDSEKRKLEEYFEEVMGRYGIEDPIELDISRDRRRGYYRRTAELPAEIVVDSDETFSEAKATIRHELSHAKLHSGIPSGVSYESAEDLATKEIEAEVFEEGKVSGRNLFLLMSHIVWRFGLSKEEAYSVVTSILKSLQITVHPRNLHKAKSSLERLPEEYFRTMRRENPEELLG